MFWNKRKKIELLEEENRKLKETILDMAVKISWCEDKILELRSDVRRKAREEWTIDRGKTKKYFE